MAFSNCDPRWPHCRWRWGVKFIVSPQAHRTLYKVRNPGHFHIVLTGMSPYKYPAMKCFVVFLVVCLVLGANAYNWNYHNRYDKNNDGVADYSDRNLDGKVKSLFCLLDGSNDWNIQYIILCLDQNLCYLYVNTNYFVQQKFTLLSWSVIDKTSIRVICFHF